MRYNSYYMADYLKSVSIFGVQFAAIGLVPLRDNHGNSLIRNELFCADGKSEHHLRSDEASALYDNIETPHAWAATASWRLDGVIPILGGLESPLKTMCKKLDTKQRS